MKVPNEEQVLLTHHYLIQESGGSDELRDPTMLDSALNGPFQTYGGKDLYPTKEEKGARLGFALISNHPFVDGNKRIGMLVMMSFLYSNGLHIVASEEEVINVGLAVASGGMDYHALLDWVRNHIAT